MLAAFGLRGIFTNSSMVTGAFMTLISLLTFSLLTHSLVSHDLLVLRLRLTEPRFYCWSEEMTPGILSGALQDRCHTCIGEGLHLCAGFFQEGLGCKEEKEEGSYVTLSGTQHAEGTGSAPLMSKCECCP